MTLVITEITKFGIAMVADSAVTSTEVMPSGKVMNRVLNGVRKLQVIPYLGAAISVWGIGSILASKGEVSTDNWLADFIERHSSTGSLDEFANFLVKELQTVIGPIQKPMGFHLSGYVDISGRKLPTFYHVRNVEGTYAQYTFHEFSPGQDYPPQEIGNNLFERRNGDYGPYAALSEAVHQAIPKVQVGMGLTIPHPSLPGRLAYLAAWVRFISDLYESSGLLKTIGGGIAAVGIYPDGQVVYYPVV